MNEAGEKSNQVGALSSKWLIEFLEMHYYIVPMHCAPYICKKLGMEEKDIGLPSYYCKKLSVRYWVLHTNTYEYRAMTRATQQEVVASWEWR